jgi:cobalamin biosynthesis Mg chelatase CobN
MRARIRLTAAIITALAAIAVSAPAAVASTYTRLLNIYQARGAIPACQFTSAQLETALKSTDTYEAQYFADFTSAITAALTQRASGSCPNGKKSAKTSAATAATPGGSGSSGGGSSAAGSSGAALPRGPVTAATGSGVPAPILILAILALILLLCGGIAWLMRAGWDPPWAEDWGHAWDEAGYRVAARMSDLIHRGRPHRR